MSLPAEALPPAVGAFDVFGAPLDGCTLVEASAGTGKTWALCGLVLRLLLERRLPLQRILVVTFTQAATAELHERIRSRIAQVLAHLRTQDQQPGNTDSPDPFVQGLLHSQRQRGLADAEMALLLDQALQGFDEAAIFTIHGYCQRALGDAPLSAGLPLRQETQADDSPLRLQVAQDFWRRHVQGGPGDADLRPGLAALLVQRGDSPQSLSALLKQRQARPLAPQVWPEDIDTVVAPDALALQTRHAAAQQAWATGRDDFLAALYAALPGFHQTRFKAQVVAQAIAQWDALLAGDDPLAPPAEESRLALLTPASLQPNKGRPAIAPHPFPALAQALLEQREAAAQDLLLSRLRLLRLWLDEGPVALAAAKRQRHVQAYDDLLLNLHERLHSSHGPSGEGLARSLRERYPAALIDEFQDTDPLQYAIFSRLYRQAGSSTSLFLVGDPKQAIYSFRHADLRTYLHARGQATREATLTENQRSVPALVQALNALFGQHALPFMLPGLPYRAVAVGSKPRAHLHTAGAVPAPLQLWALPGGERENEAEGEPVLTKPQALAAAAAATAGEIARLLAAAAAGELRLDTRAVAASDIAVLVRSHAQGARMRQALLACGVASVEHSQASVWDSPDAEELERVLAAMLTPQRSGMLRAALATDLLGLDAADLQVLNDDEAAFARHVQLLAELQTTWAQRGVGVMLRRLQSLYGLPARLLARPDGERRLTNLLHLGELLQQAAAEQGAPAALLRWLQRQRAEPAARDAEATQLRLESDSRLVQIVTIHKSKGLEYAFVFCPFLWDGALGGAGPDARIDGRVRHDDASGQAVVDFRPLDEKGAELAAIRAAAREERRAENLRLAYVALTRAVQRCTVVVGPYFSLPHYSLKPAAASPLHWLLGGSAAPADAAGMSRLWVDFALALPNAVQLGSLPASAGASLRPARPAPETVAALPGPRQPPTAWRMGSYSSLIQGAHFENAAVDHDRRVLGVDDAAAAADAAGSEDSDDILNFPRGAAAGEYLHAVFEHIDFTQPGTWPAAVDAALAAHAAALPGARSAPVLRMLADVLRTALPGAPGESGFSLSQVPSSRRLNELEFTLPVQRLQADALQALLARAGLGGPQLAFGSLQGYLRGFIDLVFEHAGRFHVLDWKSNHLGPAPAHYAPAVLAHAMDAQGYHLQLLLYTVALHRWLQQRLPGYAYDTHMGAGLYLFVRGVRPGWVDAQGAACGVHAWRPPHHLVQALSALLDTVPASPMNAP